MNCTVNHEENQIIANNVLLYIIILLITYVVIKINYISEYMKKITDITVVKVKELNNELCRIKAKSIDIINSNILLYKKSEDLENEIHKIKFKQLQNTKEVSSLLSKSFDTCKTFINLESDVNMMKHKQMMYQKDTSLFKYLVNDIQNLKTKCNELASK